MFLVRTQKNEMRNFMFDKGARCILSYFQPFRRSPSNTCCNTLYFPQRQLEARNMSMHAARAALAAAAAARLERGGRK